MGFLKLGVIGRSRKENEQRLPIHPEHFDRIEPELRQNVYLEEGYGSDFGAKPEEFSALIGGFRSKAQLIEECDVILLPKPLEEDLEELREGQILWGWPHCVQQEGITQVAIDRRLTLIAWESMNRWLADGEFDIHVFNRNNELAGYCSVFHALQLAGITGEYGPRLRGAIISFGATGRGALTALDALGVADISVLTQREAHELTLPLEKARAVHFEREDSGDIVADTVDGTIPIAGFLSEHDIIVNCVLQDPDDPYMFVRRDDLTAFRRGTTIVDVSCDEGMGFEWAVPTAFEDPMFTVGDGVHYYAVDHSPSYLWNSSTWEISDALLPYLPVVMEGPDAWKANETVQRAIEIRDGVIQNEKILSFQNRSPGYPHPKQ